MSNEEKEMNSLLGKNSKDTIDLKLNKKFRTFSNKNDLTPVSRIQILSAFIQILLGATVVAISILEMIEPIWLATILNLLGCLSIISGLVFSYSIFSNSDSFNSLINKAIKRVITFHN
ncbi:MAG TPA: hypothetical protein DHV30_19655 [Balneola sp.]|nr:hypothetical protein [Balneola sp.]